MKRRRIVPTNVGPEPMTIGRLAVQGLMMLALRRRDVRSTPSRTVRRARMGVTSTFAVAVSSSGSLRPGSRPWWTS